MTPKQMMTRKWCVLLGPNGRVRMNWDGEPIIFQPHKLDTPTLRQQGERVVRVRIVVDEPKPRKKKARKE